MNLLIQALERGIEDVAKGRGLKPTEFEVRTKINKDRRVVVALILDRSKTPI